MEANIHGIAFGQRLIDGKVEGRSFTDMKATDRGATPRHRVQFHATFSSCSILEGTGTMLEPPRVAIGTPQPSPPDQPMRPGKDRDRSCANNSGGFSGWRRSGE